MEQDELEVIVGIHSGLDMEVRISSGFELEELGFFLLYGYQDDRNPLFCVCGSRRKGAHTILAWRNLVEPDQGS